MVKKSGKRRSRNRLRGGMENPGSEKPTVEMPGSAPSSALSSPVSTVTLVSPAISVGSTESNTSSSSPVSVQSVSPVLREPIETRKILVSPPSNTSSSSSSGSSSSAASPTNSSKGPKETMIGSDGTITNSSQDEVNGIPVAPTKGGKRKSRRSKNHKKRRTHRKGRRAH